MRKSFLIALLAFQCQIALAESPKKPKSDQANVPITEVLKSKFPDWELFESRQVIGDLNGDGIKDFAAILSKEVPADKDNEAKKEALLVVFFGDAKESYQLKLQAPKAICVGCGGMKAEFGAPLGELSIANGVLLITAEGGSREMWTDVLKWRWDEKQKQFNLIGETYSVVDTVGEEKPSVTDINFLSQKMIVSIGKKKKTCKPPPSIKAVTLQDFNFEAETSRLIYTEAAKLCD